MKGVAMTRIKMHPVAQCEHTEKGKDCGWSFDGGPYIRPQTVRANAQHHVADKGHIVSVTISDVTMYEPAGAS